MHHSTRAFALLLTLTCALAACNESIVDTNPGYPYRMTKIAGDSLSAPMQTAVAVPPTIKLTDRDGNPAAGVAVTFVVNHGGGHITGTGALRTGSDGIAKPEAWVLGNVVGANTLTVSLADPDVLGNPAAFTAFATSPGIQSTRTAGGN